MYIDGIYIEQNYSKAVELYEKACDLGNAASCVKIAKLYSTGEIVEKNEAKVIEFYEKACGKDDMHSCYLLYTEYTTIVSDYYKALKWFKKTCAANDYMLSCGYVRDYQKKV
ncbi:MAG: sel1 repeat family protein [Campylobacteraceae bacterium]|jgi:TPR repeat protein|nr:sel1 repeat family protein [Campylobacteraceae bacterium]